MDPAEQLPQDFVDGDAMGLYVHSLSALPLDVERGYYLYVLDYGRDGEPLGAALRNKFKQMADLASTGGNAVVIAGTDPRSFAEEAWAVHVARAATHSITCSDLLREAHW